MVMSTIVFTSRLAVGLISSAAAAALLVPAASGATPVGPVVAVATPAAPMVSAATPSRASLPSIPGKRLVLVATAPIGMAGPAAPAPVVIALNTNAPNTLTAAELGRHEVKQGYVNEQQAAWAGAAQGAGGGAAIGALVGAIAGGIIGILFPIPIVSIIPGAISGAITGAVWGAVGGAVSGYINGQNQARAHNNAVRANGGQPVAARVAGNAAAPLTVDNVLAQVQAVVPQAKPFLPKPKGTAAVMPVRELREIPNVQLPPPAHQAIEDAKRAFARAFGIPTPR